jgi:hypothetical protein
VINRRRKMQVESDNVLFIGIDPGKNGALAWAKWQSNEGIIAYGTFRYPNDKDKIESILKLSNLLYGLMFSDPDYKEIVVYMENVWAMPGDGKTSGANFMYNVATWDTMLTIYDIKINKVIPRTWQKHLNVPTKKEFGTKVVKGKKYTVKHLLRDEIAPYIMPDEKVTLINADAICICKYGMDKWLAKLNGK